MRYELYPKSMDVFNAINNCYKMKTKYPRAIRIQPETAKKLVRYSVIRELQRLDYIDIAGRQTGKRRSILYMQPHTLLKIDKSKRGFIFHF